MFQKITSKLIKIIYSIGYVLLVEARYRCNILEQFKEKDNNEYSNSNYS